MIANQDAADKSKTSPSYKVERAKRIYRRLAKTIHPDINPLTNDNEELRDLWDRIVIAYNCNDDEELDNLEILVRKILKENGDAVGNVEIDDIDERIKKLEYEINEIITTEPYTYMDILFTEDKVNEKKEALKKEIEEYKKYSSELSEMLQKILSEGGATLTWISF
jgi:iron-sulfur cluster repair protein YtfE (RIC family)